MRSLQQLWSVRRMGEDRVTLTRVGRLRLWLARAEKEWGYAWYHGEEAGLMDMAQVPEDVVPDEQVPLDRHITVAEAGYGYCQAAKKGNRGLVDAPAFIQPIKKERGA